MRALLLERALKILLATLTISFSARLFEPNIFGELNYSISVAALVSIPLLMGFAHLLKVELDHGLPPALILARLEHIRLPIYICGLLLWIALFLFGSPPSILLAAIGTYIISPDIYEVLLLKRGLTRYLALASFRLQLLESCTKLFVVVATRNPFYFLFVELITRCLRVVVFRRKATHALRSSSTEVLDCDLHSSHLGYRHLLNKSLTLIISGIAAFAYLRSDQIMITKILGESSNGYYSAAASISESFNFVPQIIMSSLSVTAFLPPPHLFDVQKITRIKKLLTWSSCLISLGLALFARQIVEVLYGQAYGQSTTVLILLSPLPILWSLSVYQSTVLMHLRKANHDVLRNILASIANIVLNLVMIPSLGLCGAALATLISLVFLTFYPILFLAASPFRLGLPTKL